MDTEQQKVWVMRKPKNQHFLIVHKLKYSINQNDLKGEGQKPVSDAEVFYPSPCDPLPTSLAEKPYCVQQITRFSYSADRGRTKCILWIYFLHSHVRITHILFDRFPLRLQKKHPPPASEAVTAPKRANCQCTFLLNCSSCLKTAEQKGEFPKRTVGSSLVAWIQAVTRNCGTQATEGPYTPREGSPILIVQKNSIGVYYRIKNTGINSFFFQTCKFYLRYNSHYL